MIDNGGCDRYASCLYLGNGTHVCGNCSSAFLPTAPCTTNNSFTIFRAITRYIRNRTLLTNELTTNLQMSIVSFNGSTNIWLLNPGPDVKRGVATTTTGQVRFQLTPEPYTMFSYQSTSPLSVNGFGSQFVNNYSSGQDLFITLYMVERALFPISIARIAVLTWSSQNASDAYVDLDLNVQFYSLNVPSAGCIASCCYTNPSIGTCGTMRMSQNSNTSDGTEEAYFTDVETVFVGGGFYSYLIYASIAPGQLASVLKRSNAQLRIFSQASARNAAATFALTFSAAQLANPAFAPIYWPIVCMIVNSSTVVTYRELKNSSSSAATSVVPTAETWCT